MAQGIDIVGNSGKNLAVGLAVKIPHRHSADLLRNIFPQAVGQLLRHIRHDKALNKAERSADHIQADQKQQDFPDFSEIDTGASLEFIHQAVKQLSGGVPQNFRPDNREDGASNGENRHQNNREFIV